MFAGLWSNERGSEMVLRQRGSRIAGEYITRIGDARVVERKLPLVGMANGELVGFVVAWPGTSSLTSWAGRLVEQVDDAGNAIHSLHTIWHLARQELNGDDPRPAAMWETFLTDTSVFIRVPDRATPVGPEIAP